MSELLIAFIVAGCFVLAAAGAWLFIMLCKRRQAQEPVERFFENLYYCRTCDEMWDDTWDSACDDPCPVCGAPHTPYRSTEFVNGQKTSVIGQDMIEKKPAHVRWLEANATKFGTQDGYPSETQREHLFNQIRTRSRVAFLTPQGQVVTGVAVMRNDVHKTWVCDMGGKHGRPGICNASNLVWCSKASLK